MRYFVVVTGLIMTGTGALMITLLPSLPAGGGKQLASDDTRSTVFQSFDTAMLQVRPPLGAAGAPLTSAGHWQGCNGCVLQGL
jgi:hypothetical protein